MGGYPLGPYPELVVGTFIIGLFPELSAAPLTELALPCGVERTVGLALDGVKLVILATPELVAALLAADGCNEGAVRKLGVVSR